MFENESLCGHRGREIRISTRISFVFFSGTPFAAHNSLDLAKEPEHGLMEKKAAHILLVEKENSLRATLAQHLRQEGFRVSETDQSQEVFAILSAAPVHLALLGLEELKRSGIAILRMIRERFPHVNVITINSGDRLDLSIEAMRLGVLDDFLIPFDLEGLMARIRNAQPDINCLDR
ncbi:MAG: response regulator [Desulfobacteraceae bacterium]|nr:MAG: response regulator [Desulfobacteraceae bacterium]